MANSDNNQQYLRSVPFTVERTDEDGDGLTLSGYAAVFNETTRIDSWEGEFDERIAPGAFAKTIQERTPVLQFEHGKHPMLGSLPLGRIEQLREDERGLFVKAKLSNNWLIEPIRDAIRDGAVTGMSFRFQPIREEVDDSEELEVPVRTLKEVRLFELGPVVFPAYDGTAVGVRSSEVADFRRLLEDPHVRSVIANAMLLNETSDMNEIPGGADAGNDDVATSSIANRDAGNDDVATSRVSNDEIAATIREIDLALVPKG